MLKNLILGTAQFGSNYGINNNQGLLPKSKIFSILDYAYDNNLNKLDTAESLVISIIYLENIII